MSYATIPRIGGNKRLHSEKRYPYVVGCQESPNTHAIYVVVIDPGSSILFNDGVPYALEKPIPIEVKEEEYFSKKHEVL